MKKKISLCEIMAFLIAFSMIAFVLRGKLGAIFITTYIAICILYILTGRNKVNITVVTGAYALYIMIFAVVLNLVRSKSPTYYMIIGYVAVLFILIQKINKRICDSLWKWLKRLAILEASFIYLQRLAPQIYYSVMSIILPSSVIESIRNRLNDGYYTGFAREISYSMVLIAIGIGLYIFELGTKKIYSELKWIAIVYLGCGLLLSGKRATLLIFLASVFVISFIRSNNKLKIMKYIGVAFGAIIIITGTYPLWSRFDAMKRIVQLIAYIQTGDIIGITNGRTVIYKIAVDFWRQSKMVGIGWGNFRYSVPESFWFSGYDVHNCYLQILTENGYLGALPFYLLSIVSFILSIVSVIRARKEKELFDLASFSCYFQIFFLLYCITEPVLFEYTDYVLYFICIKISLDILQTVKQHYGYLTTAK